MKSIRFSFSWTVRILIVACIGILFVTPFFQSSAAPGDNSAAALAAAQDWLAQIDAGKYEDVYAGGCVAFHEKVSQEKWVEVLKTIRQPLGPVTSRKEISRIDKPDGIEGLDGECLLLKYDTSFKNLPAGIEVIIVKKEDGKWKGAGYNLVPKQATESNPVPALQNQ